MVQQTNKTMTSGFMDPDSSYSHVIVNVKLRHLQSRNDNCQKKDAVQEGEESQLQSMEIGPSAQFNKAD